MTLEHIDLPSSPWDSSQEAATACGMTLALWARKAPDRAAIIAPSGSRSFGDLNGRANRLVRALRRRGLGEKSGVALICSNRAEFMEVFAACLRAGFIMTPVNWHLTPDEMSYIVEDSEAQAVIAEYRFADAAAAAADRSPFVTEKLSVGGEISGFTDLDAVIANESPEDIDDPRLGSPMLYTSGTTGYPKGVRRWPPRTSPMLGSIMRSMVQFDPDVDTALVTGPLYHAAPLQLNAVGALAAGVGLVLMDKWDAEGTLKLVEEHRVAYTHVVPTMFTRLLRLPDTVRNQYDLSSLRAVIHGAAPCPVHVKQAMIDWLGPVIYEYYAATEGGATLSTSADWLSRPGTVGQAIEGAEVRVFDEHMNDAPPGQEGTAYFRAPPESRFVYFKAKEKTDSSYHDDYFTMGDRGYLDEDGYLFLTGRDAELIISGGVNIYPQEIDSVLLQLSMVHDVCTIGVPNEEWGEEVKAVVELTGEQRPSEALAQSMIDHCRAHLAAFKCPRSIEFQRDLPRLPSGKIQRHKVRAQYWP